MIKYNDLVQLFENSNTSLLMSEEIISVNLITASNFIFENFNIDTTHATQKLNVLYESLIEFDKSKNFSNSILFKNSRPIFTNNSVKHELVIQPNKINPLSYLLDIQNISSKNVPFNSSIINDSGFNDLKIYLRKVIDNLQSQNEFENLLYNNKIVEATKRFTKDIKIKGFNVYDTEKVIQNYELTTSNKFNILGIVVDKTFHQMLIILETELLCYDIETDQLNMFHIINPDRSKGIIQFDNNMTLSQKIDFICDEICKNIEVIYSIETSTKKFSESVYKENTRNYSLLREIKHIQAKENAPKNNSVIK